jgi:hypothetical protein
MGMLICATAWSIRPLPESIRTYMVGGRKVTVRTSRTLEWLPVGQWSFGIDTSRGHLRNADSKFTKQTLGFFATNEKIVEIDGPSPVNGDVW